jgi:hypothetical protein
VKLFLLVLFFARLVLATPVLAFVLDAFPILASSTQRLVPVFVFAYSVLGQPEYAFVPGVRLVLAKPWPHLILDGSDYIDFGIALLDDCLDVSPSFYDALRACGNLDIGTRPRSTLTTATPRTGTSTKVASPTALGSRDIGTRATTSPERLTSILYSPSFCDVTPSTMFPLPLRGDVRALVYFGFSPV